jgi:hypothetical protein
MTTKIWPASSAEIPRCLEESVHVEHVLRLRGLVMRAVLLIAVLGATASADVLKMRQVDSTNLHMAGQRGARNWRQDITITVNLGAKGRADVSSKGMRRDHAMDVFDGRTYNTDDTTTWTTSWKGTWKITKGSLVLDLALVKDACSAELDEQGTKTQKACKGARKSAVMRCTTRTVELDVDVKKQTVPAWHCSSDDARDVGESPTTWWLGKDHCIEVHAGRMSAMSFEPCSTP